MENPAIILLKKKSPNSDTLEIEKQLSKILVQVSMLEGDAKSKAMDSIHSFYKDMEDMMEEDEDDTEDEEDEMPEEEDSGMMAKKMKMMLMQKS